MAHLPCVLADAYIHELGENESAGRNSLQRSARYAGKDITHRMEAMRYSLLVVIALMIGSAAAAQTPAGAIPAPADVAAPPADATKTPSGLATKVIKPGSGKDHPTKDDLVTVDYSGWTTDGKMFDSSVARGAPSTFPVNRVIPGFSEALQLMVQGEKRRMWIPEAIAYKGQEGRPKGMLVFDVLL